MPTPGGFEQSVYVLTASSVGAITAITDEEIAAGTAIHEDMPDPLSISGTDNFMDTSVIASQIDRNEPGTFTPANITTEVFRRKSDEAVAIPALTAGSDVIIVKFEGGNIAAGDHGTPAIGDVYDAFRGTVGTHSDVDTPRGDPRRMSIPIGVSGTPVFEATVADESSSSS